LSEAAGGLADDTSTGGLTDRKTAGKDAGERTRLWSLLNSQFGLWILSTVLVGLISFLYSGFQESNRLYTQELGQMDRLRDEVADRLEQLDQEIGGAVTMGDFAARVNPWGLDGPTGVYPDMQSRSIRGMIMELEKLQGKYGRNNAKTIAQLDDILSTVKLIERLKLEYARLISNDKARVHDSIPMTDLHNKIIAEENQFQEVDFAVDAKGLLGRLRQTIAPGSASVGRGRH
jgi:hypothetical protein